MSLPSSEDVAYATAVVARMGAPMRTLMARFRDGLHLTPNDYVVLEAYGLVVEVGELGSGEEYMALPGVVDEFARRWGPPLRGTGVEVRQLRGGKRAREAIKAEIFGSLPGAFRLSPIAQGARPAAAPVAEEPERVAVPVARVARVRERVGPAVDAEPSRPAAPAVPWSGQQVIPGRNPIGDVLARLKR